MWALTLADVARNEDQTPPPTVGSRGKPRSLQCWCLHLGTPQQELEALFAQGTASNGWRFCGSNVLVPGLCVGVSGLYIFLSYKGEAQRV